MTGHVPNAYIQASVPKVKNGQDRITMKITGILVDILVGILPSTYSKYVVFEQGKKVLYVHVIKAIYGMLESALLWYKMFWSDLENEEFGFNPYDPCVAIRNIKSAQQTVIFYVDDLKSSHIDPTVNDEFSLWLQSKYGQHKAVDIR